MKKIILFAGIMISFLSLSACVLTANSGSVYRSYQTHHGMSVHFGVVDSVREVTIDKGRSGVGTLTGAALGGIAGSGLDGGRGATASGIVGAVIGGVIGSSIESNANQRRGLEITVRLENGDLKAITQDADEQFHPGERVRLLSDRRTTLVTH